MYARLVPGKKIICIIGSNTKFSNINAIFMLFHIDDLSYTLLNQDWYINIPILVPMPITKMINRLKFVRMRAIAAAVFFLLLLESGVITLVISVVDELSSLIIRILRGI